MGLSIVQKKRLGETRAEGCPAWVKDDGPCVAGRIHAVLVGSNAAGLPGIWKERSGKSTP